MVVMGPNYGVVYGIKVDYIGSTNLPYPDQ